MLPTGLVQIGSASAEATALPQQQDSSSRIPRGRHGATPNSEVRWEAQVVLALGRTICRQQSSQEQLVLSDRLHQRHSAQGYVRNRNRATVERRAFVPVL